MGKAPAEGNRSSPSSGVIIIFLHNQLQTKHAAWVNNVSSHSRAAEEGCGSVWGSFADAAVALALSFLRGSPGAAQD